MQPSVQIERAQALLRLHNRRELLLLPNVWDAGSAALCARHGFAAIATTSGGMAWSLGYGDGEQAPLSEVLAAVTRIVRVVDVPVTVDLETGYGLTPNDVGANVRALLATGAVGINLEDGMPGHGPLRPIDAAAVRIRAAREAAQATGVPLVINARIDTWMQPMADPHDHLAEAIVRARAYVAAGADCIYPIGLSDPDTLRAFIQNVNAPVNVAAGAGMPSLAELAKLGVARVTMATRLATVALGAVQSALQQVRTSGRFDALASAFTYTDAQDLFKS